VRALQGLLNERYPSLRAGITAVRFSVNRQFADDDHVLADGDEVAIIPPVSGG
jgi:molybdopterin converting factor small subunit